MKKIIPIPILCFLIFLPNVDARFWTNKEGKTFEGELVEVKDNAITIRRTSDRIKFTVNAADLSQGDQDYLKELKEKKKAEEKIKTEEASNKIKPKSSTKRLPSNDKDLSKWLAGTEWRVQESTANGDKVIRFLPDGKLGMQLNTKKWSEQIPTQDRRYTVFNRNSVKYGGGGYIATFNKDFTTMTLLNADGKTGGGELIGRFE